ncbi:MAG: DUF2163 domain-containing protein, partial [Mangrovicoccus sp.]
VVFKAGTGLSAQALQQSTGLSVDNTEALGALSDIGISETDLKAGRFDGASIEVYLVNWKNLSQRDVQFQGSLGEVQSGGGGFSVELRGSTDKLNQPQGRVFARNCTAVLGNAACGVDLMSTAYRVETDLVRIDSPTQLVFTGVSGFAAQHFERGRLTVLDGAAKDLFSMIKSDRVIGAERRVELWQELRGEIALGDRVRLQAGCDKKQTTCKNKFGNFANFRGFPHIPGEDWLTAYPRRGGANNGGSRY